MTNKFAIAVASSLCTLLLMTGVADAKGGGSSGGHSSSSSSSSTSLRSSESKKPEPKAERNEARSYKSEPKVLVRKHEPSVERKVIKAEPKIVKPEVKVAVKPVDQMTSRVNKVALNPQPLPPKMSVGAKVATTAALAGAGHIALNSFSTHKGAPTAPMADRHQHI